MFNNQRFRNLRKELKFTQKELSEVLGIKQGSLSDIERGKVNDLSTSIKNILKEKYNVNIDYLYDKTDSIFFNNYKQPEINHVVNEENIETKEELRAHFENLLKKVNKTIAKLEVEASEIDALKELKEFIVLKNEIQKELDSL